VFQKLRLLLFITLVVCVAPVEAAIHIWTGAVDDRFSVAANWSGGSPAGDADAQLSFPPGARLVATNDIAGLKIRSIAFSGSGYQIGGNAITIVESGELFDSTAGPNVISCNVVLQHDLTVHSSGSTIYKGDGVALTGVLSGPGGIRLLGGGRLVLGGNQPNTYTGVTRSLDGEMQLRKPAGVTAVPAELRVESTGGNYEFGFLSTFADEQIADSVPVTVGADGTLAVGATETIGPLTLHQPSSLRTRAWWNDDYVGTLIFGGDITVVEHDYGPSDGTGTFYLRASRTITLDSYGNSLTLDGLHGAPGAGLTLNAEPRPAPYVNPEAELRGSWNGTTIVNGGGVKVINSQTPVVLHSGRFSGTVASLNASGGVINGRSYLGGLVSLGDVRMNGSTSVSLDVDEWDPVRIRLNGVLSLGSASLVVDDGGPDRQFGVTYTIIENLSSQPVSGTFAGLPEGAIINDRWRISYVGGTGNDVTLTEAGHLPSTTTFSIPSTAMEGQPIVSTVTVTPYPSIATASGSATISRDDVLLATVPIVNGSGSASLSLPGGYHELTVRYGGDAQVAPSEVVDTVAVAPPTPTITAIDPSTVPAYSRTPITVHGANFRPGAVIWFNGFGSVATYVSSTELSFPYESPSQEGVVEGTVENEGPRSVASQPFSLTVTAPLPESMPKLTFSGSTASAPVAPGALAAWLARGKYVDGYYLRASNAAGLQTDEDHDGTVSWQWPIADQNPISGAWIATDLSTGEIMSGDPASTLIPRSLPLPDDMFLRDPQGNFSQAFVPVGRATLIQWSRPGMGAWWSSVRDGSPSDLDLSADGRYLLNTSTMQPVGSSPAAPAGVLPGDRFVAIHEYPERWLGDSVDAHLGDTPGTATISFSRDPLAYAFEDEGILKIVVLREHTSDGTSTVDYATAPLNPNPGLHYYDQAGRVTFGPGEIVKTIDIPLIDDSLYSGSSRFTVVLSNAAGASLGQYTVTEAHIADNENAPGITLSTTSSSAVEQDAGTYEVPVTVALSAPAAVPITVNWVWRENDGPHHTGILLFAPRETSKTFSFTYGANTLPEPDRTIFFDAGSDGNYDHGSFLIEDDDLATISVQDASITEGRTGYLRFSLSEYSAKPVSVQYTVVPGTAHAGTDYVLTNGTISIDPPTTVTTIALSTVNDAIAEPLEQFTIVLSSPQNGLLGTASALVTVVDDDATAPAFAAPQGFAASGRPTSVTVSWLPVTNATGYEIHRASATVPSTLVATVNQTGWVDASVVAGKTYVYRVRAVAADGTRSAFSAADVATTMSFEDDPLVRGNRAKSVHLEQLRTAVNAVRAAAALSAMNFSTPVTANALIRASHITQLRTALNEARQALGIAAVTFTDPTVTQGVTTLRAAHINELRQACR